MSTKEAAGFPFHAPGEPCELFPDSSYKDVGYVIREVVDLARQIKEASRG